MKTIRNSVTVPHLLQFEMWLNYGMFCYVWGMQTGGLFSLIN